VIRQVLAAGLADELVMVVAPVILGEGTALFDGFTASLDLEQVRARQSQFATFMEYRVKKEPDTTQDREAELRAACVLRPLIARLRRGTLATQPTDRRTRCLAAMNV
jgi:hypothetical protein